MPCVVLGYFRLDGGAAPEPGRGEAVCSLNSLVVDLVQLLLLPPIAHLLTPPSRLITILIYIYIYIVTIIVRGWHRRIQGGGVQWVRTPPFFFSKIIGIDGPDPPFFLRL